MIRVILCALLSIAAGSVCYGWFGWEGVHMMAGGFGLGYIMCMALVWDYLP